METAGSGPGEPSPLEAAGSPEDRLFLIKGMVALRWNGMFSKSFRSESPCLELYPEHSLWGPIRHRVTSPWAGAGRSSFRSILYLPTLSVDFLCILPFSDCCHHLFFLWSNFALLS